MRLIVAALVLAAGIAGAAWLQRDRWNAVRATDSAIWLMHAATGEVWLCGVGGGGERCMRIGAPTAGS